ncbi:phosphorylase family protein [Ornithinimicrobium sp. CNJ-824]|uniref:phosphorylase family protein n=1 Tax=Ornithinimicrobium sp. CNJ-824 TaxID=1904966 RepID=UPI00096A7BB5|nr:hypothetical protein [Ornithinimicrobium sp. CNJ-824]
MGDATWDGKLPGSGLAVRVLPGHGPGRVRSAVTVMHYLHTVDTENLLSVWVVGIAGGFEEQDVALGDVLVPDVVVDLGTRKLLGDEPPEFRLQPSPVNGKLLHFLRSGDFDDALWYQSVSDLPLYPQRVRPSLKMGEGIVCADEVVASDEWRQELIEAWPKVTGVEMEAGGVAAALLQTATARPFCVVRGVSDHADPLKSDTSWRVHAMNAAAILVELSAVAVSRE